MSNEANGQQLMAVRRGAKRDGAKYRRARHDSGSEVPTSPGERMADELRIEASAVVEEGSFYPPEFPSHVVPDDQKKRHLGLQE